MIRQRRSVMLGLAVAAVVVVSVLVAGPAWATEPLLTRNRGTVPLGAPIVQSGNADAWGPQQRMVPSNPPFGSQNFGPSYPFGYNYAGPSYPFGRNYTGPSYPFANQYSAPARSSPVFAEPTARAPRWVHGYWAQQWVPQYYTYDAWIPGYFTRNGAWIQGRYETQTAESVGYYERVWVDGYWTE
jgi:hypothetical protein